MKQRKIKMKQIKTIKGLASAIAKREGKKVQVNIAQINEILSVLSDIFFEHNGGAWILYNNGLKRAKKKAKPCRN